MKALSDVVPIEQECRPLYRKLYNWNHIQNHNLRSFYSNKLKEYPFLLWITNILQKKKGGGKNKWLPKDAKMRKISFAF